jgi:hypothetical protein
VQFHDNAASDKCAKKVPICSGEQKANIAPPFACAGHSCFLITDPYRRGRTIDTTYFVWRAGAARDVELAGYY